MDAELIEKLKQLEDRDQAIEVFDEGRKAFWAELEPVLNRIKEVNKEMAVDLLSSLVEFLSDSLSDAIKHITSDQKTSMNIEQKLLTNTLNDVRENNLAEIIEKMKHSEDRDHSIKFLDESCKFYWIDLEFAINCLKVTNKEMAIDLLSAQVEFLNDSLAFITRYLTRNATTPVTAEQGLLLGSLNYTIKD